MLKKLFSKRKKNSIDDLYLEQMKASLRNKDLPIVVLDNSWHQIKTLIADDNFQKLEEQLMDTLKRRGELTNNINKSAVLKNKLLAKILEISDKLNNNVALANNPRLEKDITLAKENLIKLNEEVDLFKLESMIIEEELNTYNLLLVENTIVKSYNIMTQYRDKTLALDTEIDYYRNILLEKNEERKRYATASQELYDYMHKIVGRNTVEKLDTIMMRVDKQ
ncbi:MAG: hypothetical protein ATN31_08800 [Candidatus Epulonipiscioides saccharophilum]|nr:MAG: hypothetical protein ATN31_08800 [Epulopiscium sp. AS2M-Bin001]